MKLKINEIYYSIQGESSYTGLPCIFIRLTYCNLRCTYCDSEYTFHDGEDMTINEIMAKIKQYKCNLVEVTGGEPLFQNGCIELLQKLIEIGVYRSLFQIKAISYEKYYEELELIDPYFKQIIGQYKKKEKKKEINKVFG